MTMKVKQDSFLMLDLGQRTDLERVLRVYRPRFPILTPAHKKEYLANSSRDQTADIMRDNDYLAQGNRVVSLEMHKCKGRYLSSPELQPHDSWPNTRPIK
jgi:hypothetical protein